MTDTAPNPPFFFVNVSWKNPERPEEGYLYHAKLDANLELREMIGLIADLIGTAERLTKAAESMVTHMLPIDGPEMQTYLKMLIEVQLEKVRTEAESSISVSPPSFDS